MSKWQSKRTTEKNHLYILKDSFENDILSFKISFFTCENSEEKKKKKVGELPLTSLLGISKSGSPEYYDSSQQNHTNCKKGEKWGF